MGEYIEQAISFFTDKGVSRGLAIAYLVISVLLVIMAIVALIMRIIVVVKYYRGNKTQTHSGRSCMDIAREVLKQEGLGNIQVKKASWWRALLFGNSYSLSKKTIFLRGSIANKSSITAVGIALQKVGIAKMINSGDKKAITRNRAQVWSLIGPILFLPMILIGAVLDYLLFQVFGVFSIVAIAISLFILIIGFIEVLLNIPVEKKANNMALKMIEKGNYLTEKEKEIIKDVFAAYMVAYVCEFIVSVLRIVQIILEIVMNSQISSSKN